MPRIDWTEEDDFEDDEDEKIHIQAKKRFRQGMSDDNRKFKKPHRGGKTDSIDDNVK